MNKKEIVDDLAAQTGLKKKDIRVTIEAFIDLLQEQLCANERVSLKRLGVFMPIYKGTRPVRNPRTGVPCMLVPKNSVKFRPSDDLIRVLNDKKEEKLD